MSHVVLIPGAGGAGWYWSRVVPLLEAAGHTAVALDLPADDDAAGLPEYVELAHAACAYAEDVVLVGQSLGGFTAVMTAAHLVRSGRPPRALVLLNAMVPAPGETPGAWWGNVDSESERKAAAAAGGWPDDPYDLDAYFLHDVDPVVAAEGEEFQREEVEAVFVSPCAIDAWPDVPTRVLAGADDRFFPLSLQRRVARDRLGIDVQVVPGGHLAALSQPEAVTAAILDSA
ncbi:alpha/beta fold hydrolase [Nocardioides marmorisolisilvae]|uniref:Alpha/beta hydrolase n=1 Tax=Nocardioides marmorisolisilvae TaxID=1542737 RepID=A0A3N0DSH6_9ACTN|nr:alpha/beta fold hydrolase [Nocardioides marmorisolisilvae]RNL78323.1 alpha/beta hydrolase [Nocardioides marmorisolisilvae]